MYNIYFIMYNIYIYIYTQVTKCRRGICLGVCSRPPESAEDPRGKDHIEGPASGPPKIPEITGIQWGISLGNQPKYRKSQEKYTKI